MSNIEPITVKSIEKMRRPRAEKDDDDVGFRIKTSNGGHIHISIDRDQLCCETFGSYVMKNGKNVKKELKEFIGKEIVDIVVSPLKEEESDDENQTQQGNDDNEDQQGDEEDNDSEDDEDDSMRWVEIYFKDDPIPLMIYVYNQHNGYYHHSCCFDIKKQVIPDVNLLFRL